MANNINKALLELNISPCVIKLEQGHIENSVADVIFNSTNEELDLQRNTSAMALAAAAGPELQLECRNLAPLKVSEVKVSRAYKLKSKVLFHSYMNSKEALEKSVLQSLQMADQTFRYESIALPAIGTGVLDIPSDVVAECLLKSVKSFTSKNTVNSLRRVTIVVFPSNHDILQKFERVFVEYKFRETFSEKSVSVLQVEKVLNPHWNKYELHRLITAEKLRMSTDKVEKHLWHGTSEDAVIKIAKDSFKKELAGTRNGAKYGKGCYFARDSESSDRYATPNSSGEQKMFLARVVVGDFTNGHDSFDDAPRTSSGERYDSVVDDVRDPSIFVVFENAAAYPEYIIKYKKSEKESETDQSFCTIM